MKVIRQLILAIAVLGATSSHAQIAWSSDYTASLKIASISKKPLLVYFTTDWCGWCKVMERETFTDKSVTDQSEKYIPVKLDAEKDGAALAKKLKVSAFPTFVFLNASGVETGRIVGYRTAPTFRNMVEVELNGDRTVDKVEKHLKQFPSDIRALMLLAQIEATKGNSEQAKKVVEKLIFLEAKGPEMAALCCQLGEVIGTADLGFSKRALTYAIELKDTSTRSVAYGRLMNMAAMSGNFELLQSTAKKLMLEKDIEPTLFKQAERVAKGPLQKEVLSQPKSLVMELAKQLSAQENRDRFFLTNLFEDKASLAYLLNYQDGKQGRLMVSIDSVLDVLGIDSLKTRFEFNIDSISQDRRVATAKVNWKANSTSISGSTVSSAGVLSLTMVQDGSLWRIQCAVFEPIPQL